MSHSGPLEFGGLQQSTPLKGCVVILRVLAQVKYTRALESRSWVLCKAGDVTGVSENYGAPERVMVMELIM